MADQQINPAGRTSATSGCQTGAFQLVVISESEQYSSDIGDDI